MMRVRLKADGRLVEILADGSERAMPPVPPHADARILAPSVAPDRPPAARRQALRDRGGDERNPPHADRPGDFRKDELGHWRIIH